MASGMPKERGTKMKTIPIRLDDTTYCQLKEMLDGTGLSIQ